MPSGRSSRGTGFFRPRYVAPPRQLDSWVPSIAGAGVDATATPAKVSAVVAIPAPAASGAATATPSKVSAVAAVPSGSANGLEAVVLDDDYLTVADVTWDSNAWTLTNNIPVVVFIGTTCDPFALPSEIPTISGANATWTYINSIDFSLNSDPSTGNKYYRITAYWGVTASSVGSTAVTFDTGSQTTQRAFWSVVEIGNAVSPLDVVQSVTARANASPSSVAFGAFGDTLNGAVAGILNAVASAHTIAPGGGYTELTDINDTGDSEQEFEVQFRNDNDPTPDADWTHTGTVRAGMLALEIAGEASAGAALVTANGNATPSTVAAVAAVATPTVVTTASADATPSVVAVVAALATPAVTAAATATPATVAAVVAIPTPTVTLSATIAAVTVAAVAAVPAPATTAEARAPPSTVAALAAVPTPTITTATPDATATPATVAAVAAVIAPSPRGNSTTFATKVSAIAAIPNAISLNFLENSGNTTPATSFQTGTLSPLATWPIVVFTYQRLLSVPPDVLAPATLTFGSQTFTYLNSYTPTTLNPGRQIAAFVLFPGDATPTPDEIVLDFGTQSQEEVAWYVTQVVGASWAVQSAVDRVGGGPAALGVAFATAAENAFNGIVGAILRNNNNSVTPGSGYTELVENFYSAGGILSMMQVEWRDTPDPTPDINWTFTAGNAAAGVGIEFHKSLAVAGATATPSTVPSVAAVPAPTITLSAEATGATVAAVAAVPAPAVHGDATATPATVAAVAAVPTPAVDVSASTTATPTVVAAVTAIPAPTITLSAQPTGSTVAALAAVPAPAVHGDANTTGATVAALAAIPAPTVTVSTNATPATVACVVAVPTPVAIASAAATPSVVAALVAVPAPTVTLSTTATPPVVAAVAAIPAPTVTLSADATPSVVAAVAAVPQPLVEAGGETYATPATVAALVAIPAPAVHGDANTFFGMPQNLTATPVSSNQIDLDWDDLVGAAAYAIERDGVVIVTGHLSSSYSDTTVSQDTTYRYRVRGLVSV